MITPFQNANQRLPFTQTIPSNPLLHNIVPQPGSVTKPTAKSIVHGAPDLARGLNFYADYSGCGHWRMIWPELLLNCYGKANIQGGTVMIGDKNFDSGVKTVRIQRPATEQQFTYIKWL